MVAFVEIIVEQGLSAILVEPLKGVAKMGEVRINLSNFLVVGLMAFVAVWAFNRGLAAAGLTQYQA